MIHMMSHIDQLDPLPFISEWPLVSGYLAQFSPNHNIPCLTTWELCCIFSLFTIIFHQLSFILKIQICHFNKPFLVTMFEMLLTSFCLLLLLCSFYFILISLSSVWFTHFIWVSVNSTDSLLLKKYSKISYCRIWW